LTTATELWGWGPVSPGYTGNIRIAPGLAYVSGSNIIISSPTTTSHYIKATITNYNIITGYTSFIVNSFEGNSTFEPELYEVTLGALDGEGVPTGGSTGYVLVKNSYTDYDTAWKPGDYYFNMEPLAPYFSGGSPTNIQSAILRMAILLSSITSATIP
jgi:hypothetical protein